MVNIKSSVEEELKNFKEISYKLGSNKNLVQAAGGNTSIKLDDSMFIKASGTWLEDSLKKDIFVEVNLKSIQKKISNDVDDNFVEDIISNNDLRPSTETSFHALLKFKYVLHVHSTSIIANAVYVNSEKLLKQKLGKDIAFVPYIRPGVPLTNLMKSIIKSDTQIIILENHGLIVAGDSLERTYDLLIETHDKLDQVYNDSCPLYDIDDEVEVTDYICKNTEKYRIFQTSDKKLLEIFSKSLYPDHVIFLGPGVPVFKSSDDANKFNSEMKKKEIKPPPFLIIEKYGLFESNSCIDAAREMMDCFIEILLRVQLDNEIKYFTQNQENELLNWDAEIYRQTIN
tara:strand:- start:180 stop:1205 length:1026 start_codon:yes stop_codon:yes gene_type:complete